MRVIPIPTGNRSSSRRVLLGGIEYELALRWSDFEGVFYLTLASAAGEVILAGVRVVTGLRLLVGLPAAGAPAGELAVLDPAPTPTDPALDTLGDTHTLVFLEEADA